MSQLHITFSSHHHVTMFSYDHIAMLTDYHSIAEAQYHISMTPYDDVVKVIFGFKSASKAQIESFTPSPRIVERK